MSYITHNSDMYFGLFMSDFLNILMSASLIPDHCEIKFVMDIFNHHYDHVSFLY